MRAVEAEKAATARENPLGELGDDRIVSEPPAGDREIARGVPGEVGEATDRERIVTQRAARRDEAIELDPPVLTLGDETVTVHSLIVYRFAVDLDDRIALVTPEGVPLEMVVAGVGSRFIAGMLDVAIEMAMIVGLSLIVGNSGGGGVATVVLVIGLFLILFGYHILFETLNQGRTPGKAANGIRVVRSDGRPVGVGSSVTRNLLRLVDGWSIITFFLAPIGFVTAFSTAHSQRLGDLAGGTVVVRERFRPDRRVTAAQVTTPMPASLDWDTRGLGPDEIAVIERFLERRFALGPGPRAHLGADLAARVRASVPGADPRLADEQLLEWVLARRQGRA